MRQAGHGQRASHLGLPDMPGLRASEAQPSIAMPSIVVNAVHGTGTESPGRLGSRRMDPASEPAKPVPCSRIGKCTARTDTGFRHFATDRDQHAVEFLTQVNLQRKPHPVGERRTTRPAHLQTGADPCGRPARERQEQDRRRQAAELKWALLQPACMIRQGRTRQQRTERTAGRRPDLSRIRRPVVEIRAVGPFQQGCQLRATIDAASSQPSHGRRGFLRNAPRVSSAACRFPCDRFDLVQRPAHATTSG